MVARHVNPVLPDFKQDRVHENPCPSTIFIHCSNYTGFENYFLRFLQRIAIIMFLVLIIKYLNRSYKNFIILQPFKIALTLLNKAQYCVTKS